MNHEQAQINLQLVLDWIDALRRGDIDAIAALPPRCRLGGRRRRPRLRWTRAGARLAACRARATDRRGRSRAAGRRRSRRVWRPQPRPPTARRSPTRRAAVHGLHGSRRQDRASPRSRPPCRRTRRGRARRLPVAVGTSELGLAPLGADVVFGGWTTVSLDPGSFDAECLGGCRALRVRLLSPC